ncbi:MAG: hypothetical protein IAE79_11900 [Anaerolinea sp.]|nr:hypothetical protein [Anaerolinea sp.]
MLRLEEANGRQPQSLIAAGGVGAGQVGCKTAVAWRSYSVATRPHISSFEVMRSGLAFHRRVH